MPDPKVCPICKGTGKLGNEKPTHISGIIREKECHGCGGDGWVEVSSEPEKPTEKPKWGGRPFPMY
jgi:DnaJ-class molecular chaperone